MDDEDYGALISHAYPSIDFSGIPGFLNMNHIYKMKYIPMLQPFMEMVIQLFVTSYLFLHL